MPKTKLSDTHVAIREARSLANQATLSQLNSMVNNDSAADISELLKREATAYPRLVDELAVDFGSASNDKTSNGDTPPSVAAGLLDLPVDGSVKVIRSLDQSVLDLAHATQEYEEFPSHVPKEMAATLNQVIRGGKILFQLYNTFVIDIGSSHVVKVALSLDPDHIDNTQYLATHVPELPIPHCLGVLRSGQRTYLFMSRALGTTLESVWPELSITQKTSVQEQLNSLFRVLRTQAAEDFESGVRLGSFVSGLCKDMRRTPRISSGTLRTEAEFNDFLFQHPKKTVTPWVKMIRCSMKDDHRIVMTHGDLHPRNIMVNLEANELEANESPSIQGEITPTEKKVVRVSSIIDWEVAGWYPESWEFVKAVSMIDTRGPLSDWINFLPYDAIGYFPMEFSIDRLLDQWLG
ncbi:phosphotransferase enzyme family [Pyrenophora seminiperda CCB06]|uniref:Phosphotransferase enzyme family n=1 Tax=Pyrenophora seminiperda CCB06 TaxID=1302712 RepID=A0A3M7MJQ0_9PLEO|nr:phosphotransferase enzyme family [Pyrenophora seminiperda CCB06]